MILTKGLDGNIIIVGEQDGALLTEGIETRPFTNTKARELQAYILGNAYEVELDGIGRFVIPEYLRIHAGIGKKVIFAGISQYIQLWDKDRFLNYQKRLERIIRENAEELPGKE